jgi:protein-S-isoprenylcysteine O-methyltransferase Ste14
MLIPIILIGRRYLDQQPTAHRAAWITAIVHYLIAIFLGCAVIAAAHFTQNASDWASPLPAWLGLFLMALSGLALLGGAIHLLNKGLGLPLGTEVTRVVVTNWLYAWTRNPIVLSTLAFLVGIGLWLGSGTFLLWVFALVFPAVFVFLQVFEERELEIRFGNDYLEYKQRTPMFWPRRPKNGA